MSTPGVDAWLPGYTRLPFSHPDIARQTHLAALEQEAEEDPRDVLLSDWT